MMAITLSAAIGPSTDPLPITGGPVPSSFVLPVVAQLESEQVLVTSNGTTSVLVTRGYNGTAASSHASGVTLTPLSVGIAGVPLFAPTGFLAETMPRQSCPEINTVVGTTGQIPMQAIWLQAGMVVKNITFCSATTAANTPSHYCFALYTSAGVLCGSTADQTSTAWAANTVLTLALTAAFTVPTTGIYYLAMPYVGTGVPTLKGGTAKTDGTLQFTAPALTGVSGTTYTTGTAPATITAVAGAVTTSFWGAVS
jgi:hypothetical protein